MDDDLIFVYDSFGDKRNATGVLLWPHAFETMFLVQKALIQAGEDDDLRTMSLVALGHDLLEDTPVTADQLTERWGSTISRHIVDLTKKVQDKGDQSGYIAQLSQSSEEVWLIKLADILSNVTISIGMRDSLPIPWRDSFWFPLLRLYQDWYLKISWIKYPIAGIILTKLCNDKIIELMEDQI